MRADVCVIGTGAGGAVVAKELAEAGARVVLLEEGARHDVAEFTARPGDMLPKLYGCPANAKQHVGVGTMAVFWGVSVPLYLDRRWTRPIWRACGARSGRDWMINSGVLALDAEKVGPRGHAISAAIFPTYPLWLWLGIRRGRR